MVFILLFFEIDIKEVKPFKQIVVTLCLLYVAMNIKKYILKEISQLHHQTLNVSNYSIMVSNLDTDIKAYEIKKYFEKLTKYKVEKINMTYDVYEYKYLFKEKIKLIEKYQMF
jgi:RNA recognition motif-containing protein